MPGDPTDDLRAEAIAFGRYLIGHAPADDLIERYCRANEKLLAREPKDPAVRYAREHPWTIPMLDAATGLVTLRGGYSLLRKKLLVMMAILETTPEHVARTEPKTVGVTELVVRLGVAGARTAVNAAAGLALLAMVKRRG